MGKPRVILEEKTGQEILRAEKKIQLQEEPTSDRDSATNGR